MKAIAIVFILTCLTCSAQAEDLATPTPTPAYPHRLARPGSHRRVEQINRQRALQAQIDTRAKARQAKANRLATATNQTQARNATRRHDRAQRQVETEARRESAKATPKATSELMKQMGFSDEEVAAQKAKEEPAKPAANQTTAITPEKPASASPAPQNK